MKTLALFSAARKECNAGEEVLPQDEEFIRMLFMIGESTLYQISVIKRQLTLQRVQVLSFGGREKSSEKSCSSTLTGVS